MAGAWRSSRIISVMQGLVIVCLWDKGVSVVRRWEDSKGKMLYL